MVYLGFYWILFSLFSVIKNYTLEDLQFIATEHIFDCIPEE